jgi:hypothetical protein
MATEEFERTNFALQLQQQLREWIELEFSKRNLSNWFLPAWLKNLSLPDWLLKATFWGIVAFTTNLDGLAVVARMAFFPNGFTWETAELKSTTNY